MISSNGISLGILDFRWNGILIALGVAAGALLALYEIKRRNEDAEIVYYLFLPLIVWSIIGARLWHIFTPPISSVAFGLTTSYYLSHPLDFLNVFLGGYGIPGAWIGGLVALILFSRQNKIPFWSLADLLAPSFALAQAIGRLGDYFNQQLYGLPANVLWKIFIAPEYRLQGFESVAYYHPLFAYESILNFANVVFLLWLVRRFADKLKSGDVFLAYLIFYSLVRFALEFLRLDVALVNGININQIFFAIVFLCGATFMSQRRKTTVSSL